MTRLPFEKHYVAILPLLLLLCAAYLSSCHSKPPSDVYALKVADEALIHSIESTEDRIDRTHRLLQAERKNSPEKMHELLPIYDQVEHTSDSTILLLHSLAARITLSSKGDDEYLSKDLQKVLEDGRILRAWLTAYRRAVIAAMGKKGLPDTLPVHVAIRADETLDYEKVFSGKTRNIGAITTLHTLESDIRNTQLICARWLWLDIASYDYLPKPTILIDNRTGCVSTNDTFEAHIALGDIQSAFDYDVYADGHRLTHTDDITLYHVKADKPGKHTVPVLIRIMMRSGGTEELRDTFSYTVAP